MGRSDQPSRRVPVEPSSGAAESAAGDATLAQHIWRRYGDSPGVIQTKVTLDLARQAGGFSIGRRPLLADVLRRWVPADVSFPASWSALPYAWPPAFARKPSYAALSASEAPLRHFGPVSPAPRAGRAGLQRAASAFSAEERVRSDRPTVAKGPHRMVGSPISRSQGAPLLRPAAAEGQLVTEVQDARPASTSIGNLGGAIHRRQLSGDAARAIPRPVAPPKPADLDRRTLADSPQRLGPLSSPGERAPQPPPAPGNAQRLTQVRAIPPTTRVGDLGAAILRRYLGGSPGQAIARTEASPRPAHPDNRLTRGIRQSGGRPLTFYGTTSTSPGASQPLLARLLGGIPRTRLHTDTPAAAAAGALGADAFTGDVGTSQGVAVLDRRLTHVVQQRRVEGGSLMALEGAALGNEGAILQHLTEPVLALSPASFPPVHPTQAMVPPGGNSPSQRRSLPPGRPFSASRSGYPSSTALVLTAPVRRALGSTLGPEVGTTPPATAAPLAAELPTMTAPEPTSEVDVIGLADQVYEILVHRLAMERERRGL
jgi:hypothetical protein